MWTILVHLERLFSAGKGDVFLMKHLHNLKVTASKRWLFQQDLLLAGLCR